MTVIERSTPQQADRSNSTRRAVGVLSAAFGGAAIAVQSRINGTLGVHLHDGLLAAAVSFSTGLLLLTVFVPTTRAGRRGLAAVRAAVHDRTLNPWHLLGGLGGAFLVVTQSVTVAVVGVAVFTVAMVAGQTAGALLVDRLGIGPAGPQPLTVARAAGAALAVAAVTVAVADRFDAHGSLGLVLLPVAAGVGIAWQLAVNGRVRGVAGQSNTGAFVAAFVAAFVSFAAGTVALLLAAVVDVAVRGWPAGTLPTEPWLYLGGALGVMFIAISAAAVQHTGVLLLGLGVFAGQLAGAVAIDVAWPTGSGPGWLTIAGAGLTLAAVAVAAGWRRR